jgi:DNA polymerase III delta subunit
LNEGLLAVFWGDDGYGLDQAVASLARQMTEDDGAAPERHTLDGAATTVGRIGELVATAPLFGGGTLVIVRDPYPLMRSEDAARGLLAVLDAVAPGNALAFVSALERVPKAPPAYVAKLRDAAAARGGRTAELRAPTEGRLAAWIEARAAERGVHLGRGAAHELATRVGGFVREGDVDRRRMGQLAVAELEKLALYRGSDPVSTDDVVALVSEAVPASSWAFLDAVGERDARRAGTLLPGLLAAVPEPVLVAQLHRRMRELLISRDAAGSSPPQLMKLLGSSSGWAVEKLVGQAARWTVEELEAALEGILELDDRIKGSTPATDAQRRLAFTLWIAEHVGGRPLPATTERR